MLLALRDYLVEKQTANLQEMAWHFKQQPETVRCWLDHWIRKGKVCRAQAPQGCGTKCQRCPVGVAEVYNWR